jgi:hypothetical protein
MYVCVCIYIYIYIWSGHFGEMTNVLLSSGIKPLIMTSRSQLMLTQARSNSCVPTSLNAQTGFIIQIKCLFLVKEKAIVITVGSLHSTTIHCVGIMQSCLVSHRNTHIEALCSKRCSKSRREYILITL